MNLFGKKKPTLSSAPAAPPVDAIKEINSQLIILEKRENLMVQRIQQSLNGAIAKKSKGDTKGALFELKRKKMFESELQKLQGARITLDSQIIALEGSVINLETVRAMKVGADAMKKIHGNLDADKVEDLMDSIQEQKDMQDAISEAISKPGMEMFDDEDLLNELAELESLEQEEAAKTPSQSTAAFASSTVFSLPSVPSGKIRVEQAQQNESEEERALRELEASMLA